MKIAVLIWVATAILVWLRLPSFEVITLQTVADIVAAGFIGFMGVIVGIIAASVSHSYSEAKARVRASAQKRNRR